MSYIVGTGECGCDCHRHRGKNKTRHCVPCCDGQCPRCHKYVKDLPKHQADHEAEIARYLRENSLS